MRAPTIRARRVLAGPALLGVFACWAARACAAPAEAASHLAALLRVRAAGDGAPWVAALPSGPDERRPTDDELTRALQSPGPEWLGERLVLEQVAGLRVLTEAALSAAPLPPRRPPCVARWEALFRLWRGLSADERRQLGRTGELRASAVRAEVTECLKALFTAGAGPSAAAEGTRSAGAAVCLRLGIETRAWVAAAGRLGVIQDTRLARSLKTFAAAPGTPPAADDALAGEVTIPECLEGEAGAVIRQLGERLNKAVIVDARCEQKRILISPGRCEAPALVEAVGAACGAGVRQVGSVCVLRPLAPEDIGFRRAGQMLSACPGASAGRPWQCALSALPEELGAWAGEVGTQGRGNAPPTLSGAVYLTPALTASLETPEPADRRTHGPRCVAVWLYEGVPDPK